MGASILIGAGLALLLLLLEKSLAANYFLSYRLPEPYPYLNHGLPLFLLFFYVGWAVYWGIRDVMDDQPGVARSRIFWWRRDPARGAHMKERSIGAGASLALALLAQRLYEAAPSGAQKVIALIVLGACGVMALGFGLIFATIVVYSLCGGGSTDL